MSKKLKFIFLYFFRVNISPMLLTKFNKVEKTFQKLADNMEGTNTSASGYAPQEIDFAGGSYAYQVNIIQNYFEIGLLAFKNLLF